MVYNVKLIKDRPPYKEGQVLVGVNLDGYTKLYNDVYIDDEHKIIKAKKSKKKDKEVNN